MSLIGCFSVLNFRALFLTNQRHCGAMVLVWFCRRDSPASSFPEDFRDYTLAIDCVQFQISSTIFKIMSPLQNIWYIHQA